MRLLTGLLLSFLIAAGVGLGSTWYAVTKNLSFGELTLGAWRGYPHNGTADIDPYARAALVRNGELPVGIGDGITFTATVDDDGHPLDGRCDVVVQGTTPPARYFTLSLYTTGPPAAPTPSTATASPVRNWSATAMASSKS